MEDPRDDPNGKVGGPGLYKLPFGASHSQHECQNKMHTTETSDFNLLIHTEFTWQLAA